MLSDINQIERGWPLQVHRIEADDMHVLLTRFSDDEGGATAIEYGLITVGIALGIIVTLGNVKTALVSLFTVLAAALN